MNITYEEAKTQHDDAFNAELRAWKAWELAREKLIKIQAEVFTKEQAFKQAQMLLNNRKDTLRMALLKDENNMA